MRSIFIFISIFLLQFYAVGVRANVSTHYEAVSVQLVEDAIEASKMKDTEKALILYQQAMVANPKNINAYLGLGYLHSQKGQYSLGMKYFDIALSIDPIDVNALEGRVLTNLKMNDLPAARESFSTMQQVCEVTLCEQLPRIAEAIEDYQLAEESN